MTHYVNSPKKRIFSLIRYTKLLLAIIFANRNIVYLYISAMLFSLLTLLFFALFSTFKRELSIDYADWQLLALTIGIAFVFAVIVSALRNDDGKYTRRNIHPNFPIVHESAEITKQLAQLYIYHRDISPILRIKALGAVLLVTTVSIFGALEQQMLRSMSSVSNRFHKQSNGELSYQKPHKIHKPQ